MPRAKITSDAVYQLPDKLEIKLGKAFMWGLPSYQSNERNHVRGLTLTGSSPGPIEIDTTTLDERDKLILIESLKTGDIVEKSVETYRPKTVDELIVAIETGDSELLRTEIQLLIRAGAYKTIADLVLNEKEKTLEKRNKSVIILLRQGLRSIQNSDTYAKNPGVQKEITELLQMMGISLIPAQYALKPKEEEKLKTEQKEKKKGKK